MNQAELNTREYPGGVVAIDSGLMRPQMAACYLVDAGAELVVIETGVNASVKRILATIEKLGRQPDEVSHVIVTHVHLDHAGGAGQLMQHAPNATLLAHPRAARHLIDPSRLEASARGVYDDRPFDDMYGTLVPVAENRVRVMNDEDSLQIGSRKFCFLDTPGHARHHFVVWDETTRGFFSGDTFGISYRETDSPRGPLVFPTTTPIQFDPPALIQSIERMMAWDPQCMYLTHFGRVTDVQRLARDMIAAVQEFADWGEQFRSSPQRTQEIQAAMMARLLQRSADHGVAHSEEFLRDLFINDVKLNTQGIEFRLEQG